MTALSCEGRPAANNSRAIGDLHRAVRREIRRKRRPAVGRAFAKLIGMSSVRTRGGAAAIVGRSVAVCVHPYAAWRRHRAWIAAAYFTMGFMIVLSGLLFLSSVTR